MDRPGIRGFTLIELIVVILIIGGILAVVLPRLPEVTGTYLKTDSSRLAALIRYLDEASASKRVYYRVSFDLDNESVFVEFSKDAKEFTGSPDPAVLGFTLSRGVEFSDIVAPGLGKVASGKVSITITPQGSNDHLNIHLRAGDAHKTLSYNPYTGRVRVEDGPA